MDGANSTWNCTGDLSIATLTGTTGLLQIYNGSYVSVTGNLYAGGQPRRLRGDRLRRNGGTLSVGSILGGSSINSNALLGTGTIATHGIVADYDVLLSGSSHNSYTIGGPGQGTDVTVNLDASGILGAGLRRHRFAHHHRQHDHLHGRLPGLQERL